MKLLGVLRASWRSMAVFAFDLLAVCIAWVGAFYLATNLRPSDEILSVLWVLLFFLIPAQALVFWLSGLYRGIWYFSSLPDLLRIAKAIGLSGIALAATLPAIPYRDFPRTVLIIYPILLMLIMAGGRAAYRIAKEHYLYGGIAFEGQPVLILGAGHIGAKLAQELARSTDWRVVGFLDDDPTKQGREVMGKRVYGPITEIALWSRRLTVRHAILAIPSESEDVWQRLTSLCVQAGVTVYAVPTTEQLLSGHNRLDQLRPVNLDDLLGRTPVNIDTPEIRLMLSGRVVMVTGAGGSIGSELCRQIMRLEPAQLLLYDNSEYALYTLHEELTERFPSVAILPLAGDIKDSLWLSELMRRHVPSVVFHAAAYKHVPLMETQNAWQAVRNNVLGTYVVALAALSAKVPEFVLVSTDKAVNPTNVMGASKRMAEMVCQALQGSGSTRFEIVRFGNVLGSTGSVVPKFQAQIRKGGPVTVTHPEITRYFMSIPEATQLVLQAAAMGEGGEIFVLDMGKPVRIADLARDMIRLSGCGEKEIPIVYTGLRPGEKLYEEPLSDDEFTRPTHHPKLRIAKARAVSSGWLEEMLEWLRSPLPRSDAEVRRDLRRWVAEYQPATPPKLKPISVPPKEIQAS